METETPAVAPEASADLGVVHTFKGKRLEPLTSGRLAAYQRLELGTARTYETHYTLLYICTQGAQKLDKARSEDQCSQLRIEASDWAESLKLSVDTEELHRVANEIWDGYLKSRSEPDLKNETGTESPNA